MAVVRDDRSEERCVPEMAARRIYINEYDLERLKPLLDVVAKGKGRTVQYVLELQKELEQAKVIRAKCIPRDVVTINSRVRITNLDSNEQMIFTIVFPDDAHPTRGRLSILAPICLALLGYRVGDTIEWGIPSGMMRLKLEELLYQPEADGNYDL